MFGATYGEGSLTFADNITIEAFQKWGLDFIGPFKPPMARSKNCYVLTMRRTTAFKIPSGAAAHSADPPCK